MYKQALILAGGFGTRLGNLTKYCPKPMLQINGCPFLEHVITNLCKFDIGRIVLSVGYLANVIEQHFSNGSAFGVEILYSYENAPLGTGGGVKHALQLLDNEFLVLNGDTVFDCNYLDLMDLRRTKGVLAALALTNVKDASRYGSVQIEGNLVQRFLEKAHHGPGSICAGVYAMTKQALAFLPDGPSSLEIDLFPKLAKQNQLAARAYNGFFLDIGLPKKLVSADALVRSWKQRASGC